MLKFSEICYAHRVPQKKEKKKHNIQHCSVVR